MDTIALDNRAENRPVYTMGVETRAETSTGDTMGVKSRTETSTGDTMALDVWALYTIATDTRVEDTRLAGTRVANIMAKTRVVDAKFKEISIKYEVKHECASRTARRTLN